MYKYCGHKSDRGSYSFLFAVYYARQFRLSVHFVLLELSYFVIAFLVELLAGMEQRKRILRKLIILFVLFMASLSFGDAVVVNPGFESVSNGWATNWSKYPDIETDSIYYALKSDNKHSGSYSAKIAARNGYGMIYQEVSSGFNVGQKYLFSFYGLGDTSSSWIIDEPQDRIEVYVKFVSSSGATISEPYSVVFDGNDQTDIPTLSSSQWKKSQGFEFTIPNGTVSFLLKIVAVDGSPDGTATDGTSVLIDDVELSLVTESATDPVPADGSINISAGEVHLSYTAGTDPAGGGGVNPEITGYYIYHVTYDLNADPGVPVFSAYEFNAGTVYPEGGTGLVFGTNKAVYWRVDASINNSAAGSAETITGPIWKFTTANSSINILGPDSQSVFEGESAVFSVQAQSDTEIVWYKWYGQSGTLLFEGATAATLTIDDARVNDIGSYYCIVRDLNGQEKASSPADLWVSGIMLQYSFEDGLLDAAGNCYGTLRNAVSGQVISENYCAGVDGDGIVLDGESYIDPGDSLVPDSEMGIYAGTFCCWLRSTGSGTGVLAGCYNSADLSCFNVSLQSADQVYFHLRSNDNSLVQLQLPVNTVSDGQWHFLAVSWQLNASVLVLYDGEIICQTPWLSKRAVFSPWQQVMTLGALNRAGDKEHCFSGELDELEFYNYALNGYELIGLYNRWAVDPVSICLDNYASCADLAGPDGIGESYADCQVDLYDFAALAVNWLECGLYPVILE